MAVPKMASFWLLSSYRAARKIRNCLFLHRNPSRSASQQLLPLSSCAAKCRLEEKKDYSLVCDFHSSLLRTSSLFPFFMAVAFEGGGPLRAILLLLAYPAVLLLRPGSELATRVMAFVTFCGLRKRDVDVVARAVLPKIYMDELHRYGYEVAAGAARRVVVSSLPKVMVERFLKEYVGVSEVVAPELEVAGDGCFTGNFSVGAAVTERQMVLKGLFGEDKADMGLVNPFNPSDQLLIPCSKEICFVTKEETNTTKNPAMAGGGGMCISTMKLPREDYRKPLIFHDGRLAFLPTPAASLSFLLWLPFAALLSVLRILIGVLLPYKLSLILNSALGVRFRVHNPPSTNRRRGVLYVCTHRTLLDPIFLSHALSRRIPAVTYSVSPLTESISPIPTVRLMRDRRRDADTMRRLLAAGELAICPEGTTCREPYLLRFSPLFAELADDIEPVALDAESSMFYGTTASGLKFLDPIFFFMNPRPGYHVSFLGRLPPAMTVAGGMPAADVANKIQRELAEALGFERTALTRRDKYLMLAGNDGMVPEKRKCQVSSVSSKRD